MQIDNNVRLCDTQLKMLRSAMNTTMQMVAPHVPWSTIVKVYARNLPLSATSELSSLKLFGYYKEIEEMDTNCVRGNQRWSHTMIHNDWTSTLDEISNIKDHKFSFFHILSLTRA